MKLGTKTVEAKTTAINAVYIRVSPLASRPVDDRDCGALLLLGLSVVSISAGGDEVLTQPSHSLA
jgi:hypothetical protein